ncbi:MAG: bacteriohemerythrin [Candidatus Margulisbacteria bacterium]|nr:bacteriohemerythrin [Candidatus Margulisiibacteriota bacterium]
MLRFEWDNKYSVNIDSIDEQHKKLLMVMNDLHYAMVQGKGRIKVAKLLRALLDYSLTHSSYEEAYMSSISYPGLNNHKLEHQTFINNIKSFMEKAENPNIALPIDVINFLKDWFLSHVLIEDKKYEEFSKR